MGGVHEVSIESLETVFDKALIIVNLHSFLQFLALPRQTFPPSEWFVPHSKTKNNFQNSPPLDTSATPLECIYFSNLNHSCWANQKNLIFKGWNYIEILFFSIKKQQKRRQALLKIIWASSLSIIFVEFSFRPLYPTVVVKNFKLMKNYSSWKMY